MARYIDADALENSMNYTYNELCGMYGFYDHYASGYYEGISAVENAPTADVAPKSEVAREIFEEIEKCHLHITNEFDAIRYAELKKKCTEGKV